MGVLLQLQLLLWKNFIHRKRQPIRVLIEIVWPLCLFFILVAVRTRPDVKENKPECHYNARAMPSAGSLAFLQSYVCTLQNKCNLKAPGNEVAGLINPFSSSVLDRVVNDVETILSSQEYINEVERLLEDAALLAEFVTIVQNSTSQLGDIGIRMANVIINRQELEDLITNQSIALTSGAVDTLLNATLDVQKIFTDTNRSRIDDFVKLIEDIVSVATSANGTNATAQEIQTIICDDEILLTYFEFGDEAKAKDLQSQVCNLTLDQLTTLADDIYQEFNMSEVIAEVEQIVTDTTGKIPNFNSYSLETLTRLSSDILELQSLTFLFRDLTNISQSLTTTGDTSSLISMMSNLVCGEGSEIFSLAGTTSTTTTFGSEESSNSESEEYQEARRKNEEEGLEPECAQLFANFQLTAFSRIVWRQLKPIVLGVIPYTPDSPATRKIIKEASRFFDSVATVFDLVDNLEILLPDIESFLENDIEPLREFFNSSTCQNLVDWAGLLSDSSILVPSQFQTIASELKLLLGGDPCSQISKFIDKEGFNDTYDWRDALNNTYELLRGIQPYFKCFRLNKFVGYDTLDDLVRASLDHTANQTFFSALVFDNIGSDDVELPSMVQYAIRMDPDRVDSTKKIRSKYLRPGPRDGLNDMKYFTFWFIFLQDMVDHAIIRLQTNTSLEPGVYTQQFPYPCWIRDRFVFTISRSLPLFMIISWIYSVAMIVKGIVYEKEMRLKEVMKIMGLGNGVHWVAWFINSFVIMLVTIILFCIVLKTGNILEYSDVSVVFVFMLGFTVSTISLCFLISVFFSRANLAAVCGGFIYFVLYLPYTQLVQWEDETQTWHRVLACLSSNIAMGYGCSYLAQYEEQAVGAQWGNIRESPMVDDTFNLSTCIAMMFLDTFIYLLLTWYIEAVFPGQYGIRRKPWFFIQKSYWIPYASKKKHVRSDSEVPIQDFRDNSGNFEKDSTDRKLGVQVQNLCKVYSKGDKVAVDGLSINFYEGQITSFLGHNGAGKTTTMSILTGLFAPTSGTAYVYGQNILTDIDQIRRSMGMCPQHNVLFDLMTVEEHIWFYAKLKGRTNAEVKAELDQMVNDVGLPHKRKEKSENLSGGMKRKLSVAIAFVGGSRTVILDEPTAGVDPYARRAIWDLLVKFRKGRTIILSTHHMDEADILGDRIAIISHGKLCSMGTSLFLKDRYGSGYYLTLARSDEDADMDGFSSGLDSVSMSSRPSTAGSVRTIVDVKPRTDTPDIDSTRGDRPVLGNEGDDEGYDEKNGSDSNDGDSPTPLPLPKHKQRTLIGYSLSRLTAFIQNYVPGASLVEENSMEVCFRLPEDGNHASKFQKLFSALELTHFDMGISSYGISDTSLEEVFLKVTGDSTADDKDISESTRSKMEEMSDGGRYPRPVSKLSIRKPKTSLFQLKYRNRVNSTERLTGDIEDTESMTSEATETYSDMNFSGAGEMQVTGKKLVSYQMLALMIKRFHHVRRSKKGFISEIILPAGFVCLAMIFSLILPPFSEEPRLELQPWMYESTKGDSVLSTFYSNNNPTNPVAESLEASLLSNPFYGTRCMNSSIYSISGKSCLAPTSNNVWTQRPQMTGNLSIDSPACSCSSGFQRCPEGAGGPVPSLKKLENNDRFHNLTGRNISDWLTKTMAQYQKRRFGGFTLGEENNLGRLNSSQISSAIDQIARAINNNQSSFSSNDTFWKDVETLLEYGFVQDNVKVWFNNKGWAASVSYMNAMNNVILRSLLPQDKDPNNFGIVTYNHPMNYTKEELSEETLESSAVDVVVAICVIFAMSFVPASFVLFLIEERVSNSKHLQFVSGINPTIYWLATWSWDMINYAIPALLCILIFLAFGKDAYVSGSSFPCLFALLFLYGWSITPMMYPFSRLFDVPSSAFVALSCVNVFLGTVSTLSTFILELLAREDPELHDINVILKQVFLILPHYCLGRGLIDMASYKLQADTIQRYGETFQYDLFAWTIVGRNLFSMFMLGIGFNLLNWLIEYKFFLSWMFVSRRPLSKISNLDADVAREKERVLSGGAADDVMRIEGLTKVYWTPGKKGKMTAVDNLYVGVPKGQCFGLLGVNGAGKTTTFKMLTGDVAVSKGDAYINQYSIRSDMVQVRQFMGYCPQFDALDPLLTAREHLEFYARIRGINTKEIKSVADWAVKRLGLLRYADTISSSLSGGNKRKLSTAIALIGNPSIIFLDEPTTGMDPNARRFLWNCINSIVKSGRSVILTSHSMEECEALCSRLAIMVNGGFQCLGSIQHLKNRFGNGYTIILRVSGQSPDMSPVSEFITSTFPSAILREKHCNMLQYQLGTNGLSLSQLFAAMEEAKNRLNVEDYSVSQTTLDQVFINFAKKQTDLKDDELDENALDNDPEYAYDNQSNIFCEDSMSTAVPSEFDEQSVTGSTVELVRPGSSRSLVRLHSIEAPKQEGLSNVSIA